MSHTICRVRKISTKGEMGAAEVHNSRQYEELGYTVPDNIQPDKQGVLGYNHYELWLEGKSMMDAVEKRLKKLSITPRKGAVIAHEYLIGVSKDWYEKANYSASGMLSNLLKFIINRYGSENIVSTAEHFDETTPHMHVVVMPVVKKERKWKNKNGSGSKISYGLSASDFIDGKDTLSQLQTDFFEFARRWDQNGAVLRRGLLSEEQTKEYTYKTNHLLGELRELNNSMTELILNIQQGNDIAHSKAELEKQKLKYDELNKSIEEQQKLLATSEKKTKYRKGKNKDGGWMKGIDF
ncbi:MAG: plasmid recombination protein [Cyclobacteriaceae bacterium]